uniref:Uncharacterized protein n=1 Tax=Glossina pallidipes TaxID=7398 RepID=A0A1A9ZQ13_GLOPL
MQRNCWVDVKARLYRKLDRHMPHRLRICLSRREASKIVESLCRTATDSFCRDRRKVCIVVAQGGMVVGSSSGFNKFPASMVLKGGNMNEPDYDVILIMIVMVIVMVIYGGLKWLVSKAIGRVLRKLKD